MRLDKFLANMGYGSRKEVKISVKKKKITVNNEVVRKADIHIDPDKDEVAFNGTIIEYKANIYIMLNKPGGYLSATEDSKQKTVLDLIAERDKVLEPFPVGRLDKDTEGLLLLTNDGQLAHDLLSPNKHITKTYIAKLDRDISDHDVQLFEKGITLDDGYITKPAVLRRIEDKEVEIKITEGKFHQIKRMFEALDNKVLYLKRVAMGNVQLDESLKLGEYRELTEEEWQQLQQK
ncbi:pseudouridine synthase [Gracilibacillus salinarum]|uniref:Pseudouridine synthase n=1 Tax=Gracilibacillus salinarum TaxID=2932255 RepID=A0ABY4GSP7_9BACI|nr:pseudouridine synthase [Gracilibacillus salinarum]UOQ87433.1 rRNA pseudouridine synthase [Gracilibacillus salinarum]